MVVGQSSPRELVWLVSVIGAGLVALGGFVVLWFRLVQSLEFRSGVTVYSLIGLSYPRALRDLFLPPLGPPSGGPHLKNYLHNLPNGNFFNNPPSKRGLQPPKWDISGKSGLN